MTSDAETIAALCTRHPLALAVLKDLAIDVADPSLAVVACCAAHDMTPDAVYAAVQAAEDDVATRWSEPALEPTIDTLLDGIVRTFHRPFAHELRVLRGALEAARAATQDDMWSALLVELAQLETDLVDHVEMEERVVFPWLRKRVASAIPTIRALMLEHGDAIVHLLGIEAAARRCLAAAPEDTSVRTALAVLDRFERWLCEHIHVESNLLFPQALRAGLAHR